MNASLAHDHLRIAELTIEHFALENDELQATIRDLYQQNAQLRETLHACLDALRAKTKEARELREQIDYWQKERRRPARKRGKPDCVTGKDRTRQSSESSWTH
jgi:predicted RNase H-like nuclease (RuvC/YqgF family)